MNSLFHSFIHSLFHSFIHIHSFSHSLIHSLVHSFIDKSFIHSLIHSFCVRMKQQKIIIANNGPDKNVMCITLPMCFTCENAHRVIRALDECLTEIECSTCPEQWESLNKGVAPVTIKPTELVPIPASVVQGDAEEDGQEEGGPG